MLEGYGERYQNKFKDHNFPKVGNFPRFFREKHVGEKLGKFQNPAKMLVLRVILVPFSLKGHQGLKIFVSIRPSNIRLLQSYEVLLIH